MTDRQRDVAATALVGADPATRFVFAINDICDSLKALATDTSDPAMIADVVDVLREMGDFPTLR
jgi:hypothetical protein